MIFDKVTEKITALVKEGRLRTNVIIIAAALLVLLIMLPGTSCERSTEQQETKDYSERYAEQLEQRLEDLISSVEGAGQTEVLITLQSGKEYIYASQDNTSTDWSESVDASGRQSSDESEDRQSSLIIIDTDEGEQALVRTELMPSVSGVVVVCQGAGNAEVAERIMSVVTTALNISSKRVCITQLTQ